MADSGWPPLSELCRRRRIWGPPGVPPPASPSFCCVCQKNGVRGRVVAADAGGDATTDRSAEHSEAAGRWAGRDLPLLNGAGGGGSGPPGRPEAVSRRGRSLGEPGEWRVSAQGRRWPARAQRGEAGHSRASRIRRRRSGPGCPWPLAHQRHSRTPPADLAPVHLAAGSPWPAADLGLMLFSLLDHRAGGDQGNQLVLRPMPFHRPGPVAINGHGQTPRSPISVTRSRRARWPDRSWSTSPTATGYGAG